MVRYTDDSIVPIPRDRLRRLLDLHAGDDQIPKIHPEVVSQQTVAQASGEFTARRGVRMLRKVVTATWRVSFAPGERYRWEVLDGNGPWTPGSYVETVYSDVPEGTRLRTEGELTIAGFPGFLQNRLVRLVLGRIDREDLGYLAKNP